MLTEADIKFVRETLTFWEEITREQQKFILDNTKKVCYRQGVNIHNGQTDCIGVIIIKTGGMRTYLLSEDGREITIFRLSDGDVCTLSASCIFQEITFDVQIDAEFDTEAYLINPMAFQKICTESVYADNFANKSIVERFSDVMWAMEQILFMSFDKRLAIFLLDETLKQGSDIINLTHEQIAKYMGSAREVVTRMLKYFSSEGFVELSRGSVAVKDKDGLRKLTL